MSTNNSQLIIDSIELNSRLNCGHCKKNLADFAIRFIIDGKTSDQYDTLCYPCVIGSVEDVLHEVSAKLSIFSLPVLFYRQWHEEVYNPETDEIEGGWLYPEHMF